MTPTKEAFTMGKELAEVQQALEVFALAVEHLGPDLEKLAEKVAPQFERLISKWFFQGHDLKSLTLINVATQLTQTLIQAGDKSEEAAKKGLVLAKIIVDGAKETSCGYASMRMKKEY